MRSIERIMETVFDHDDEHGLSPAHGLPLNGATPWANYQFSLVKRPWLLCREEGFESFLTWCHGFPSFLPSSLLGRPRHVLRRNQRRRGRSFPYAASYESFYRVSNLDTTDYTPIG